MGRNRLFLGKPVATSKESTAFPKKRYHGTAEGLQFLTLISKPSQVSVFEGI